MNISGWDVAILTVAAYVAVTSLVRLMRGYRDRRIEEFREEYRQERQRQAILDARAKRLAEEEQKKQRRANRQSGAA